MRLLIGLLLLLLSVTAEAKVAVIVHPSNQDEITLSDVKRLYTLRQFSFPDGNIAFLFMLPYAIPEREIFDQAVSGLSSNQLMTYWSKIVFSGKGTPPRAVSSVREMISIVASTPSAIGYVPEYVAAGELGDQVRVIVIIR